jgi:hypothetical protein
MQYLWVIHQWTETQGHYQQFPMGDQYSALELDQSLQTVSLPLKEGLRMRLHQRGGEGGNLKMRE